MSVAIRVDRDGLHARIHPSGPFDQVNAMAVVRAVETAETSLQGCQLIDVDLSELVCIDGAGAFLLARLLDRLAAAGPRMRVVEGANPRAERLIGLYQGRRTHRLAQAPAASTLARIGEAAAGLPFVAGRALDFIGRCAAALPKALLAPGSVDWRSLPKLFDQIGADAMVVTSAANLLVGLIIGFLGVSQLSRFGTTVYVPELVVVAQFRELGPLVTAIVVAGRSGAGLASELATMQVSEEIDALRAMGFDPIRWLVIPRCLALAIIVPLLTWIGDAVALAGGMFATEVMTDMPPRAYLLATADAISAANFFGGLIKSPFLALAIGMIACGQGLAARGGAAAVGARTTSAVVLSILGVITINAVFTLFYALMGI